MGRHFNKLDGACVCAEGVKKKFPEGNIRNRTTASRPSPEFPPACRACGSQEDVLTIGADCDFTKRKDLQCSYHGQEFSRVVCLSEMTYAEMLMSGCA